MIVKTPVDQIAVNLLRTVYVGLGNQYQNIKFDLVALEEVDPLQNRRVGRPTSCGTSIAIVYVRRTVEAASDEKPVAGKMFGRPIVNQRRIRLDAVCDSGTGATMLFLQISDSAKEVKTHEHGFAALPTECVDRLIG